MIKLSLFRKIAFGMLISTIFLCGCRANSDENQIGLDFVIENGTATYIDYFYKVKVKIPNFTNYSFVFEHDDPTPEDGQEYMPSRSLIMTLPQSDSNEIIEVVGILGTNGYYESFNGQEIEFDDGKYKIEKTNDRVFLMYVIDTQSPFLRIDITQQNFELLKTDIMEMAKSLQQYTSTSTAN